MRSLNGYTAKRERFMSRTAATGNASIGQMIDSIWSRLPENHYLNKLDPANMHMPHENLLVFGQAVIANCEDEGTAIDTKLTGSDHGTWLRLVGAWALHLRKRPMTRNIAAKMLGMDPSNLTNFINGKRALTANALNAFADLFQIQPFDLKPDLGANFARTAEKRVADKLEAVSKKVEELRLEVQTLISSGISADKLMVKVDELRASVSA